jgi:dephospho-CoA kinase
MNIFALTGNMGCGKSTIAKFLQKNHSDIYFFDCDQIAKKLLFNPKNTAKIQEILDIKIIDKSKIAKIIFNNPEKKQQLENFIHPLVWQKLSEETQKKDKNSIFIVESAIFYEIGKNKDIDKIILVTCDYQEQKNRIKNRDNFSNKEIETRLKDQLPTKLKKIKSSIIINTNCSLKEMETKTEKLYSYLKNQENYKLIL